MRCQPKKWILPAVLGAGLPFLGAWMFSTSSLDQRLASAAQSSLAAAGSDWAQVSFDGRDARVTGEGPSEDALVKVREAVLQTYGVRRVALDDLKVLPPPEQPTVASLSTNDPGAPIVGTWPEAPAAKLSVSLVDQKFVLGVDSNLTSDGKGNWSLVPPAELADGERDVAVEVADRFGRAAKAEWPGKYLLDRVAPAAPTIAQFIGQRAPAALAGTWPEGDAQTLKVTSGGKTYALGTDKEISSKDGQWALALAEPVAEGAYPVTVEVTDAAGNSAKTEMADAIIVDTTPPPAPAIDKIISSKPLTRLTGTWPEGEAQKLKVTLGDSIYERGTYMGFGSQGKGKWTLDLPAPLAEGAHKVTVEATDIAGNIATATIADAVIVDTTPPATPTIDQIISNKPVSVLTGTWDSADATSLKVTVDGSTYEKGVFNGLTTAEKDKWRLELTSPLTDGEHAATVETRDAAGNISTFPRTAAAVIDTKPPAPPTIDTAISRTPISTLSGTFDAANTTAFKVTIGDESYVKGTYNGFKFDGGRWTLTPQAPLEEGDYNIGLEAADAAGNITTQSIRDAVIVDRTPPAPPTVNMQKATAPVSKVTGTWDSADAKTLKVTVGANTYENRVYTGLTTAGKEWSLALASPLGNGSYDIKVETADAAGNTTSSENSAAIIVKVEKVAPTVNAVSGKDPKPIVTGTAGGAPASLAVSLAGKVYVTGKDAALTLDSDGNWSLTPDEPLKDGTYDVVAVSTNSAGERSSDESVGEVVIDSTPPVAPTVDKIVDNKPAPTINGTMGSDAESFAVSLGGKVYVLGKDSALKRIGDGLWSLTPEAPLPEGIYDVVAVAADKFGNRSSDQTVGDVTVDLTGPVAPTVNRNEGNSPTPVITGTVENGIKSFAVSVAGKVYSLGKDESLTVDKAGNWTLKISEAIKDGIYDVVAVAADQVDNRTSDETVGELTIDTTPPSVPTVDAIANNDPSLAISGTMDMASDKVTVALAGKVYTVGKDANLTVSPEGVWSLKAPEPLKEGVYDVVVVSEDKYGNRSSDASTNEITIDLTAPQAPTVNGMSGDDPSPVITGAMDPSSATFAVSLAGTVYALGKDEALAADGKGNWSLKPAKPLNVGRHDVVAVSADQYGNRSSDSSVDEVEILEKKTEAITPPSLNVPTVRGANVTVARPRIEGTWDEQSGTSLKVTLADRSYVLGTDENLTSDGNGNWALNVPAPLKDGVYDVRVDTTAPGDLAAADSTADELLVDAAGPASPTVKLYSGETSPASIAGTWAEGDAVSLSVTLNGKTAILGETSGLSSDGSGNWKLQVSDTLPPASYDVVATSADKAGRTSTDQTKFEVLVKAIESAQPVPQPMVQTDCGAELAKLLVLSPLMFETAKSRMKPEGKATIEKAAELIAACPDKKFQIAGHTDSRASSAYNQALSERRAVQVRKALVAAGVPSSRLSAVGYGEARPLASNETDEGMTLNRRIEITVIN